MAMIRALRTLTGRFRYFSEAKTAAQEAPGLSPVEALIRERLAADPHRDAFKVASQGVQWTYTELNVRFRQRYTSAFAHGLLEMGLTAGDSVAFWTCKCDSAETVALQLACARAGLQAHLVPSPEGLADSLKEAKALIVSPWIAVKGTDDKRIDVVIKLVPETRTTHWGTPLQSAAFPGLKYIVQLGFSTIRGTIKAKNVGIYGRGGLQAGADTPFLSAQGSAFSQKALLDLSSSLASELHLGKGQTLLNLINPKSPASLLGALASFSTSGKVVMPGDEKHVGKLAAAQQPTAILLDAPLNLAESGEVEYLVVAETSGQAAEALAAKVRDSGLKAKKVAALHAQTLQRL